MRHSVYFDVEIRDIKSNNIDDAIELATKLMETYLYQHREDIWKCSINFECVECSEISDDD